MVYISDVKDLINFIPKSMQKLNKSNIKLLYFEFAFLIMKNPFFSNTLEFLSGLMRILQLISIPLSQNFVQTWTDGDVFQIISNFINYFNVLPLLKGDNLIFLVTFYIGVAVVIALFILAVVCMNYAVNQQQSESIAFFLFKFLLVICSSFIYVPFLRIFLGFFWKIDKQYVFYSQYALGSPFRIVHIVIGIIFAIGLMVFSLLIQSVLFEIKYSKERKYAKTSSKIDLEVILGQTFLVVLTIFFDEDWVIIFFSSVISLIILWDYVLLKPYFYSFLTKMFMVYYTTFVWSNFVLLLSKIFKNFNGGLILFGIGIPFIILCCFFSHDQSIICLMKTINKCENDKVALKHIQYLLDVIQTKDISRRSKILLDGYIYIFEETCHVINCPLAKFLTNPEEKRYKTLLYQHIESIYRIALKKYPNFIKLRISFANFLNDILHKKSQALEVLNQNFIFSFSLEDEFLIYRYKRDIEEDTYGTNNSNNNKNFGNNKLIAKNNTNMLNISYKNKFTVFKKEMTNVSALYVEFWNLLMTEGSEAEKLLKLNNLGTKITEKVEKCEELFQKLQKMNAVDYEVLFYYSEFLKNVTNKGELADKYKEMYEKILQSTNDDDKEDTFLSVINTKDTTKTDEYQFIIVSSNPGSFGIIQNISLGFCILLGYTKDELIGKHVNIMIPEIIQKAHHQILNNKLNEFKHSELNTTNENSDMPIFKTVKSFAVDKAKYLIEVSLRAGIFHSELYGNAFVARTCENYGLNLIPNDNKCCYVLTNTNFAIQTFTTSAVPILGLNSNFINCGIDITKLIKQFYEEYFKMMMEQENTSTQSRMKILKEIAEKIYSTPNIVNFRNLENIDPMMNNSTAGGQKESGASNKLIYNTGFSNCFGSKLSMSGTNISKNLKKGDNKSFYDMKRKFSKNFFSSRAPRAQFDLIDEGLLLSITKVMVLDQHKGYVFKFEKINQTNNVKEGSNSVNVIDPSGKISNLNNSVVHDITPKGGSNPNNISLHFKDSGSIPDFGLQDQSTLQFVIDPNKMSYVLNKTSINEARDQLRQLALDKIKVPLKKSPESAAVESSEGTSEYSSDDSHSYRSEESKSDDDISKDNKSEGSSGSGEENKKQKKDSYEEYYKIDFTNIKMMQYDFRKKIIVSQDYEKITQVEKVMNSKKDEHLEEKELGEQNENALAQDSLIKEHIKSSGDGNGVSKSTAHQIIEYTLSKKETQPALLRLKIFSFTTFFLILVFVIVWFVFVNWSFKILKQNYKMIYLSYNTIMNSLFSICNVRQLTLLANENYTGYLESRESDFNYTINDLNDLYTETHQLMKDITTSSISMKKEHKVILDEEQVTISIYDSGKDIKSSYFMTLQSSIIEGNTALKHILTDLSSIEEYIPLETNIYFYLENSIRGIYTAESKQVGAFEEELYYKIDNFYTYMLIIVLMNLPVLGLCYFLIVMYFRRTTKRKEEYLIIFFDIGINVIKCLLQNCEDFNNKIQCESILDFFNEEMSLENDLADDVVSNNNNINNPNLNVKSKKNHIQHTDVSAQENIHLEILLCLFFVVILIINILIFIFTDQINNSYKDFIEVFKTQIKNNNEYLMLMINIREYCFGTLTYMGVNDNDITKYLETFQENVLKSNDNSLEEKAYSSPFSEVIFDLYQGNICETNKEYITVPDTMKCEDILYNSSKYGFNILLSTYFTQLRAIKNQMDYLYLFGTQNNFTYNMTLFGTKYADDKLPSDPALMNKYFQLHPMIVFNSEPFLSVLYAYRYIIKGCISGLFKTFTQEINDYINNQSLIMNIVLGIFVLFVLACYFGIWIRYERKLNNTIYKTKNMLSIIPVTILANIPSVFKVLEINSMIKNTTESKDRVEHTDILKTSVIQNKGLNLSAIQPSMGSSLGKDTHGGTTNAEINQTPQPGLNIKD